MTKEYPHRTGEFLPASQFRAPDLDKVFVRDLVLPAHVGMWANEKGVSQRVRFCVELSFHRAEPPVNPKQPVISYDLIVEVIRNTIAQGHILLVETLAEDVARQCLLHPEAECVRVCVEKLDLLAGAALGCEIVRRRGLA